MATKTNIALGIEAVGMRHSVAVAADMGGKILASARLTGVPMTFHTTCREQLKSSLLKVLKSILNPLSLSLDDLIDASLCIGMTGVTFGFDRHVELPKLFEEMDLRVGNLICTGDAEIVFASHLDSRTGGAIICHSGSTAYFVNKNGDSLDHVRFGGWGPAFGDEGSGYWIGRSALAAIAEEHDMRKEPSILWGEIVKWLREPEMVVPSIAYAKFEWEKTHQKISSEFNHLDPRTFLFYCSHQFLQRAGAISSDSDGLEVWRRFTSSLVLPVVQAASRGDVAAFRILKRAAESLAVQFKMACRRASVVRSYSGPVVLYGGVLTHNSDFSELVMDEVRAEVGPDVRFISPRNEQTMRPALGALLFALGSSRTGSLQAPAPEIRLRVFETQSHQPYAVDLKND